MATRLKNRPFQNSLYLSIGATFLLFVVLVTIYQHRKSREYKIDILTAQLQAYSYKMSIELGDRLLVPDVFYRYVDQNSLKKLRVTVIDTTGRVLIDSRRHDVAAMDNHKNRREVEQALRNGTGYDLKRKSETLDEAYFYCATRIGDNIVRTALPYSAEITKSLQMDYSYIWYTVIVVILLIFVLYHSTSRIRRHIGYLRDFAIKAQRNEPLDLELDRRLPDDELGEISHTITTLYWKLRHSEEEKERIKRQLTQNAAHELKTPVASIHGYLESIMEHPEMDDKTRQRFIERCYAQSKRMTKLMHDMSALTKLDEIEQNRTKSNEKDRSEEIDVAAVVRSVADELTLQLTEQDITVKTDMPDTIMLHADHSLVYSIFRNLFDNSIAYSGATRITIRAKALPVENASERAYEFLFMDNGVGVAPQHLARLFERFYRVDKGRSRKLGGTGLGLAIVKNAVTAHGGTCTAEMTHGGGLTVRFTLRSR